MSTPRVKHQIDKIVLRGAQLKSGGGVETWRENLAKSVTDADLSLGAEEVTELTITLADPGLRLMRSGAITMNATLSYEDLQLMVGTLEVNPGPAGTGGIILSARSYGVSLLKARVGALVMKNASPTDFITAECKAVGLKVKAQRTASRQQIARDVRKKNEDAAILSNADERPSSWTTFKRLADEVGFMVFEVAGTVYFGQPSWLIEQAEDVEVGWFKADETTQALTLPTCRKSKDDPAGTEITFDVPYTRARQMRPGKAVKLRGLPGFNGRYLITKVDYSLAGLGPVSVTAKTPVDPEPNYDPTGGGGDGGGGIRGKGKYGHIANAARDAGFRGDALVIAVAIAIAESGGVVDAVSPANSNGTRDYGLWQINSVHTSSGFDTRLGLSAGYNAKWAYKISEQGRNWKPWSTYWSNPFSSGAGQGKFREYMDEARQSIDTRNAAGGGSGLDVSDMARGRKSAYDFVRLCLSQTGDPYEWGAVAPVSDPNPHGFDCSELVAWAAGRVGVYMPGYSVAIMDYMRSKGTTMSIERAIKTRGAILYKAPGVSGLAPGHIAVSLGNGKTIEAAGGYGVVSLNASGRSFIWTGAGLCPGMKYEAVSKPKRDYTSGDYGSGPGA